MVAKTKIDLKKMRKGENDTDFLKKEWEKEKEWNKNRHVNCLFI